MYDVGGKVTVVPSVGFVMSADSLCAIAPVANIAAKISVE